MMHVELEVSKISSVPSDSGVKTLSVPAGEWWWGGAVADGQLMPFGKTPHRRDLAMSAGFVDDDSSGANQSAPLLVSSSGRYVWSERPFTFAFDGTGGLELDGQDIVLGEGGSTLSSAFRAAADKYFPASHRTPAKQMFTAPQYNTWIEMPHHPTQDAVLDYAKGVLDGGFPPGVMMIDDRWSVDYGAWTFDRTRFPHPADMTRQLHELGFSVMLWLVPFVSPDSENSRMAASKGWLIKGPDGRPVVREWWNGYSTVLDLTHPEAVAWLRAALHDLMAVDGVDGFKFDAGDLRHYRPDDVAMAAHAAVDQCEAWARLGAEFSFNEMRACWKMGGQPLAQRLHDKPRVWGYGGLASLIPEAIAQGLIGHSFNCPDMVGGGELGSFRDGKPLDQELFVRFGQCSALFPMMQFSLAPWRVLDDRHLAAILAAVKTRAALMPYLSKLVDHAANTGEPILRPLAYHFPAYQAVHDEFLLGEEILCAPVLEQGAATRHVVMPPGRWRSSDGSVTAGPTEIVLDVQLESMPYWRRIVS
jgi:alpha-glucosidase (family GH31 glycosyl hydrolase)